MAQIQVAANDRRKVITAILNQTAFLFDFPAGAEAELTVTKKKLSDGVVSNPAFTAVFTATGGTVTIAAQLAGDIITIEGTRTQERSSNYLPGGEYRADDINADVNLLTKAIQEDRRDIGRAVMLPPEVADAVDTTLPEPVASTVVGFDAAGLALELTLLSLLTNYAAASQVEAEAGTEAGLRSFSPLRIKQAIDALAITLGTTDVSGAGWVLDEDNFASDDDTKVPTQQSTKAYIATEIAAAIASEITYKGGYNAATNTPDLDTVPIATAIGDMYTVTVAGTFFTIPVEVGDVLIAEIANATVEADWTIINKNLDSAELLLRDGTIPLTDDWDVGAFGLTMEHLDVEKIATAADDHAVEVCVDAAGFGDVKALDIAYETGAIATGDDVAVNLVNIDGLDATGGEVHGYEVLATEGGIDNTHAYGVGVGVHPVHHHSGTFVNPTTGTNDTPSTDVADMIDGSEGTNTDIFVLDDDYIIIGAAAAFTEMEFNIETPVAAPGIRPTFWYSITGTHQWTQFVPVDGTNGFRNSGIISWSAAQLTAHVADAVTGTFDIKIMRTHNSRGPVSLFYAKTATTTIYSWDKDGAVSVKSLTASDLTASEILISDGSKKIVSAPVGTYPSLAELIHLKDVTSAIQTQLNAKGTGDGDILADGSVDFTAEQLFLDNIKINGTTEMSRGADVASASTLPLIQDGNFFNVTGTTNINDMDSLGGAVAYMGLQFDGILTLVHGANLILPGGANITTAAGDVGLFVEYAAASYRCISWQSAIGAGGGTPWFKELLVQDNSLLSISGVVAISRIYAAVDMQFWVINFDDTAVERATGSFSLPEDYDGGAIDFDIMWTAPVTTGDVVFQTRAIAYETGDDLTAFTPVGNNSTATTSATADTLKTTTVTFTPVGASANAGQMCHVVLTRIGNNVADTLIGDIHVIGIKIHQ